jgi:hypothetical protein
MGSPTVAFVALAAALLSLGTPLTAGAQDLEPRAYTAAPTGLNFLVAGVGRSTGGVVVDPALPVEDVEATVDALTVGAGTTFSLFGRTALLVGAAGYVWAEATGRVGEDAREVSRSGLADPRFKLSVNLLGGRALSAQEFARAGERPTIVGVSLSVVPPLGKYDRTKLINLGSNRWSFKPEVGISRLIRRKWHLDGYAGVWMFTENGQFYPGPAVRTQQPVLTLQGHISYTFRPRLWVAVDGTWYSGGRTSVDGIEKADLQRNSRLGLTTSLPLTRQQSLKIAGSTGATTRIGADFQTIGVAWQLSWLH